MPEARKSRIGLATMIFMPLVAIVFDIISLLVPIGWLYRLVIHPIWFLLLGIRPFGSKNVATAGTSAVVEMIPVASSLPTVTLGVIIILFMIKLEDKTGIKLPLKK